MGVLNFFKIKIFNKKSEFNEKNIAEAGMPVTLKDLKGMRICNDASLMIYQSILALESVQSLTDTSGNTTVHINVIFNKIIQQAEAGIDQFWIFDSPILNEMKIREYERRKERREKAAENDKNGKVAYKLTEKHVKDIQQLLTLMGIMYATAPPGVEAEQYGAKLTSGIPENRFCQYMLSGDSDVLFFGGNLLRISQATTATGKSKKTIYQKFDLSDLLKELGITYDEFLKVGVVMGTDFNEKADKIGPATVMKKYNTAYITPAMQAAINYFKSDISEKIGEAEIIDGKYDRNALLEFLTSRNFNKERSEKRLDAFEKAIGVKS
jgi:5'-3' exonuclease